jgi:gluconate 2-dehydrogenase gamma chain
VTDHHDRRVFLRAAAAAGVGWAVADLAEVEAALDWAAEQASGPAVLRVLSRAQADVVEAAAGRVLPSVDGRPGAREAGALYFIDRALLTFNSGQKKLYTDGIAGLNRSAERRRGSRTSFAALTATEQDEILRDIEPTPFFQSLRVDTIVGTFALPAYGGNRDYAGWRLLGLEHQMAFQAPFGYYDADANGRD